MVAFEKCNIVKLSDFPKIKIGNITTDRINQYAEIAMFRILGGTMYSWINADIVPKTRRPATPAYQLIYDPFSYEVGGIEVKSAGIRRFLFQHIICHATPGPWTMEIKAMEVENENTRDALFLYLFKNPDYPEHEDRVMRREFRSEIAIKLKQAGLI